jgi:hypothetical protein
MLTPTLSTTIIRAGARLSRHGGNGNGPTIRAQVLPAFNLVTKFFEEFRTNYQSVKTKKLHTLQEF